MICNAWWTRMGECWCGVVIVQVTPLPALVEEGKKIRMLKRIQNLEEGKSQEGRIGKMKERRYMSRRRN